MILYHYTSVDTLLKIIDNVQDNKICFRATHAKYFNDPNEYELAISLFKSSLRKYEKEKSIENGISNKFNTKRFAAIGRLFGKPFILSFSEKQDDLTMWRTYGSDGKGVAIGLDKELLENYSKSKESENTNLIKCNYNKRQIIKSLVNYWNYYYDKIEFKENGTISFSNMSFPIDLTNFSFSFKRSEYETEKEWRLCKNDGDNNNIKFRESEGLITPYINHLLPKEIIKKIIIGPCSNKRRSKESIITFLKIKGILNAESVVVSRVPYRKV